MANKNRPKPFVLMILDGYGISLVEEGNAVMKAKKPVMDSLMAEYPFAVVNAGGENVGLPWGEMGNSETGHQNIGSGRVMYQFLPRIEKAIADGTFFKNPALTKAIEQVKNNPTAALHTVGMLSNGGIHSHMSHQFALLRAAAEAGIGDRTYIHIIVDGQDSPTQEADRYIAELEEQIGQTKAGHIATLIGRYYAMDRAQNWDRTKAAYDLLTAGIGKEYSTWRGIIDPKDPKGTPASVITGDTPVRTIQDGDAVVFYNYRSDRARQLTQAFAEPNFSNFPVKPFSNLLVVTMASYDEKLPTQVMFPDEKITHSLGEMLSAEGLTQLRIAESEKFAHVTYFLNGGREQAYEGETDVAIPSLTIKDFSKEPQMKAAEITDRVVEEIEKGTFDVIIMNYANPDMVAHTGNFDATVKAVEFVDLQIGRVVEAVLKQSGTLLITCDHGNAESCVDLTTNTPSTDHNNNPVPVIYVAQSAKLPQPKQEADIQQIEATPIGFLADVAPTVLEIMGIEKPSEMTGQSLLTSLR